MCNISQVINAAYKSTSNPESHLTTKLKLHLPHASISARNQTQVTTGHWKLAEFMIKLKQFSVLAEVVDPDTLTVAVLYMLITMLQLQLA